MLIKLNNMIRTNSKKFKDNFKKFIFEVIESEDLPKEVTTERQKLDFIMDRFRTEAVHKYSLIRHKNNLTSIMAYWLSGLALNIPYTNYDIIELAKKLLETDTIKNPDRIINNYFYFMAEQLFKLIALYGGESKLK